VKKGKLDHNGVRVGDMCITFPKTKGGGGVIIHPLITKNWEHHLVREKIGE